MTTNEMDHIFNAVNQNRHFDFDSASLTNKIINIFMIKWAAIVRKTLIRKVEDMLNLELDDEVSTELRLRWLDRLFQRGKVDVILEKFKKAIDTKVIFIPSNFLLAGDLENAKLKKDEAVDEELQLETIRKKRARVIQLRIEIETLKKLKEEIRAS